MEFGGVKSLRSRRSKHFGSERVVDEKENQDNSETNTPVKRAKGLRSVGTPRNTPKKFQPPSKLLSPDHTAALCLHSPLSLKTSQIEQEYEIINELPAKSGRYSTVLFVASKNDKEQTFALKCQIIKQPNNLFDVTYRELRIFQQLSSLQKKRKCFNFISILRWVKAYFPPFAFEETQGEESLDSESFDLSSSVESTSINEDDLSLSLKNRLCLSPKRDIDELDQIDSILQFSPPPSDIQFSPPPKREANEEKEGQCMYYVLEKADMTLHQALRCGVSLGRYKEYLFQIFWALYIGQQEVEFVHNDFHFKNILLQPLAPSISHCVYFDGSDAWYTTSEIIKITDFGLSRIKLKSGDVVYNPRGQYTNEYLPHADVAKLHLNLKSISIVWTVSDNKESESRMLQKLKRQMGSTPVSQLLRHPFFSSLSTSSPAYQEVLRGRAMALVASSTGSVPARFSSVFSTPTQQNHPCVRTVNTSPHFLSESEEAQQKSRGSEPQSTPQRLIEKTPTNKNGATPRSKNLGLSGGKGHSTSLFESPLQIGHPVTPSGYKTPRARRAKGSIRKKRIPFNLPDGDSSETTPGPSLPNSPHRNPTYSPFSSSILDSDSDLSFSPLPNSKPASKSQILVEETDFFTPPEDERLAKNVRRSTRLAKKKRNLYSEDMTQTRLDFS